MALLPANRLDLRAGRARLQYGLRHYPAFELRAWRHHHGRRLRRVLRHDNVPSASDRLRCHCNCGEHDPRCGDRKGRLYAAPQGAAFEPAHHGHRHFVPAGEWRAAALRRRHEEHGPDRDRSGHARQPEDQQGCIADNRRDNCGDGCADADGSEDEARQGHACGV